MSSGRKQLPSVLLSRGQFIRQNPDQVRKAIEVKRIELNLDHLLAANSAVLELADLSGGRHIFSDLLTDLMSYF